MPNKIVLIRPENVYNYNNYPPLNLISIGSQLKAAGYDVRIINCAFENNSLETITAELDGALMVGISMLTSEVPDAYRIMERVRNISTVPIVAGGWHCTLFPEQMSASRLVDYVVCGEGEEHILTIANSLKNRTQITEKIFAKKNLDLDMLPLPDYDLDQHIERFITSYLTDKLSEYVTQPMRWLPYESSRGCPSLCTFCINVVADNQRYRKKSAAKVLDEIEYLVNRYKLTHLKIIDDNFFVDIKRVREICSGIVNRNLNITWDGECRCDYFNDRILNDEMLELCKRSGLIQLTLGIESGSPRTLKIMKKGITPEQAEYAVKRCDQFGIIARSSFMIEVPGETRDDIKQTIGLINRLRRYHYFTCGLGTFRPYPKCELTEELLNKGYLQEPATLEEWTDRSRISLYTSAEYERPWQVDGRFSETASYYINMESAVRLGNYQIHNAFDRFKNNLFIMAAKLRNRCKYYGFPFEKNLYKKFLADFYDRRQKLERSGAYPMIQQEKGTEQ